MSKVFVQVLTWSAYSSVDYYSDSAVPPGRTGTATFNPSTGSVSAATVDVTNHDMFCPGISMLSRCAGPSNLHCSI